MDILSRSQDILLPTSSCADDYFPDTTTTTTTTEDNDHHQLLAISTEIPLIPPDLTNIVNLYVEEDSDYLTKQKIDKNNNDETETDSSESEEDEDDEEDQAIEQVSTTAETTTTTTTTSSSAGSSGPTFECSICYETVSTILAERFSCGHQYCQHCISQMITTTLDTGSNHYHILCPDCGIVNTSHWVYSRCDEEKAARLRELQSIALADQTLAKCSCPRKGCGAENIVPEDAHRVRCCSCNRSFCGDCLEVHSRFTPCTAAEVGKCIVSPRTRGLTQLRKVVSTAPCPNCGVRIEKNGGCCHMSCQHCHFYFCWHCKKDLSKGGPHCIGLWVAGITALVVVGVPTAIVTAPVWIPVGGVALGAYMYSERQRKKRYRRRSSLRY